MSISKGDAVVIEGNRFEGEEGRVIGFAGDEVLVDIFDNPGKTREILPTYLTDSPFTENEEWPEPSEEKFSVEVTKNYGVPPELEEFDEEDRVEVIDSINELFVGATGTVFDAEKINGEWAVMVALDMPHDRNREFSPDELKIL